MNSYNDMPYRKIEFKNDTLADAINQNGRVFITQKEIADNNHHDISNLERYLNLNKIRTFFEQDIYGGYKIAWLPDKNSEIFRLKIFTGSGQKWCLVDMPLAVRLDVAKYLPKFVIEFADFIEKKEPKYEKPSS